MTTISVSTFASLYKTTAIPRQFTIDGAVGFFCHHTVAEKKDSVPLYSGAVYGANNLRNDCNVVAMSAVVVDYDNGTDAPTLPEDQFTNLGGMLFFYHSTHSNTATNPKWRLILPLDRHVSREEWPFVVRGVLETLGGNDPNIDTTCFEPARAFYVPSYPAEHASAAFSGYGLNGEVKRVR